MAGSSACFEDGRSARRYRQKGLLRLKPCLPFLSPDIAVFMLMVLAVWSVAGRKFFAFARFPGYVGWIEFRHVPLIAIMGISLYPKGRNGGMCAGYSLIRASLKRPGIRACGGRSGFLLILYS